MKLSISSLAPRNFGPIVGDPTVPLKMPKTGYVLVYLPKYFEVSTNYSLPPLAENERTSVQSRAEIPTFTQQTIPTGPIFDPAISGAWTSIVTAWCWLCWSLRSSQDRTASRRTFRIQHDVPRSVVVLLLLASIAEVRSHVDCNSNSECSPSNVTGCLCACYFGGHNNCPTKNTNGWGGICHSMHVNGINYGIDKGNNFFYCPERPCPSGTFNKVSTCVQGGLGRGGGTECSCTTCPSGKFNNATGATVCVNCDAGKFKDLFMSLYWTTGVCAP